MNKDKLLELLQQFFSCFYYHPALLQDILNLLSRSGLERDFLKSLLKQQTKYDSLGRAQAEQLHEFEPIDERLYSMHVIGRQFNIRILYAYQQPADRRTLLHAFWERVSADYQPALRIARARLQELEEETT